MLLPPEFTPSLLTQAQIDCKHRDKVLKKGRSKPDFQLSDEEFNIFWCHTCDLKMADYKKADFNTDNIDEVIIIKPSAPTLVIELGEL